MNLYYLVAGGLFLVVAWGHGFLSGVPYGSVRSRLSEDDDEDDARAENVARTPQRTTTGGGTVYHPETDDSSTDLPARTRGKDEREASPRGFRGRDLSDREVEAWLKRWNL